MGNLEFQSLSRLQKLEDGARYLLKICEGCRDGRAIRMLVTLKVLPWEQGAYGIGATRFPHVGHLKDWNHQ
jgi:hypothetical protein